MKVTILYIVFILSVIAMIYSINKIRKVKNLTKLSKAIYIYISILIPFLGLYFTTKLKK